MVEEKDKASFRWLTRAGIGVISAVLQPLGVDPVSSAAVSALSSAIGGQLEDYASKLLSLREAHRVDRVAEKAIELITTRLKDGYKIRSDGFFETNPTGRSDAGEIFEGVLLKAKDEPQEKKAQYLANLFANTAFRPDISVEMAHHFLKLAERLTNRQFCLVSFIDKSGIFNAEMLRRPDHADPELAVLKREEMDLHANDLGTYGLLGSGGPWTDKLSPVGRAFSQICGLNEIPENDLADLKDLLRRCGYVLD